MDTNPTDESRDSIESDTDRRSVLKALGAAGVFGGSAVASTANAEAADGQQLDTQQSMATSPNMQDFESFEISPNSLVLGGKRIVGDTGYDTIQEAWEDSESGDVVYVHSSYDAKEAGEEFPIELNYQEKEVLLTGGHASGSVIDASHTNENVIEVLGENWNDYRNNPNIRNLKIKGGNVGLRIRGAPFAHFENLIFFKTGSHGVLIDEHVDPESEVRKGTYGAQFYNCQTWACGGDGFKTNKWATPHGTTFFGCKATNNTGAGFRLRGYTNKLIGGTAQLNRDVGIEARLGKAMLLENVYIEGNARANDFPVEVYVHNSDGLTIDSCYFNGTNGRTTSHDHENVLRAVNVHSSRYLTVRDCTARNYDDGFLALFSTEDADVHCHSNYVFDADMWAEPPYLRKNRRVRSGGMIMPTNLKKIEGHHFGDMGFHRMSDGECCPAVWYGGEWHAARTETL